MTNGKSLAKMNRRTIFALIKVLVWIASFHSTSCNAFVLGVQASQRGPKMPSTTIQLTNNGPANTTSSFLQLPKDSPAHFKQTFIPATTASTGLQADNDRHSSLNDVTALEAFSAMTATMIAAMTQVPAITTTIMNATIKLVECFLYPTKTGANNAKIHDPSLLLPLC
jgi:hypothetical protein